jgi:hypothetical protein
MNMAVAVVIGAALIAAAITVSHRYQMQAHSCTQDGASVRALGESINGPAT